MKAVAALLAVVPTVLAQPLYPSPPDLLKLERPLTTTEIALVLDASRKALTAKTIRLSSDFSSQGPEVLMGPAGQPKIIRYRAGTIGGIVSGVAPGRSATQTETRWREDVITVIDYTGRPARDCDGSAEQGEMVIEYRFSSSTQQWSVTARRRDVRDPGGPGIAPPFEMLGGAGSVTSGQRRQIGDRLARAFVSSWTPAAANSEAPILTGDPMPDVAGDPAPNDAKQSLWIDSASLLPLRWGSGQSRHVLRSQHDIRVD
jgi:hypothetical protein